MAQKPVSDTQKQRLSRSIKIGLIRELYRKQQITQAQFEQLMQLQRRR